MMGFVLVRGNQIAHRRLFMLFEVALSVLQLFKGFFVAFTRLAFMLGFFGARAGVWVWVCA